MSDFFSLVAQLQTLINNLDVILSGGDSETVEINGVDKDSISKALKDKFSEIQSITETIPAYQKLSELLTPTGNDGETVLARVVNDDLEKNNGLFHWEIGVSTVWNKSKYDNYSILSTLYSSLNDIVSNVFPGGVLEKFTPYNSSVPEWGVVDKNGTISIGVNKSGGFLSPGSTDEFLASNPHDLVYGIVDVFGMIALGIDSKGSVLLPGFGQSSCPLIVENGHVFKIFSSNKIQLTFDGENASPFWLGNKIRFASNRQGGWAEYEMDFDGKNQKRNYRNENKYEMVIVTGQSLAQGGANSAITITPPFANNAYMFSNGPIGSGGELLGSNLEALREEVNETISTGYAKKVLSAAPDRNLLVCGQAVGGYRYEQLKKGTDTYSKVIQQVTNASLLSGGTTCRALFVVHGEQDGIDGELNYESELVEWITDYNNDIKSITGQSDDVLMFICQSSSAAGYKDDDLRDEFKSPFAQLDASENNSMITLVTPKYHFSYKDHSHIDAISTRLLGEYYGKVYRKVAIEGQQWKPLSPKQISVTDDVVVIEFNVPVGSLVFDDVLVSNPGNYGFNLISADKSIVSMLITGNAEVTITLSAAPEIGDTLSYAFHNGIFGKSGSTEGARGCLRDCDIESASYDDIPMYNWCVTFKHNF